MPPFSGAALSSVHLYIYRAAGRHMACKVYHQSISTFGENWGMLQASDRSLLLLSYSCLNALGPEWNFFFFAGVFFDASYFHISKVLYFLHSTLVLSFNIDVVLTLGMKMYKHFFRLNRRLIGSGWQKVGIGSGIGLLLIDPDLLPKLKSQWHQATIS